MSKIKVVVTGGVRVKVEYLSRLSPEKYSLTIFNETSPDRARLADALIDADCYMLGGDELATREVISGAPRLKLIACLAIGANHLVDIDAATDHGVAVSNTPGMSAMRSAMAELAIGHIIALRRQMVYLNNQQKSGVDIQQMAPQLLNSTIGIIGMGNAGSRLAKILVSGFGAKVIYTSRSANLQVEQTLGIQRTSLDQLLSTSDVVVLMCEMNQDTLALIDERKLALMKPSSILINTASAVLVDGPALYRALRERAISGASTDDYNWDEPPVMKDGRAINLPIDLLGLPDNVFFTTPYIGCLTEDSWDEMADSATASAVAFFDQTGRASLVNDVVDLRKG